MADSIRRATVSDVALVNGGSIRVDEIIRPGRLTERDVLSILPFKNKLVKIEVTGDFYDRRWNMEEHGCPGAQPGAFPQVSGIQFSYDASRQPGDRIVQLKVNGQPVSPSRKYSLATTAFVALDGGDGYAMLKNAPVLTSPDRTPLDSDALRRALIGKQLPPRLKAASRG